MCAFSLPPPILVADDDSLGHLVRALASSPVIAVDTESNSLHAYRERVCLVQFSIPGADYIVDPITLSDLSALAPVFASPDQQKIFHAAENDIVCLHRAFGFVFANIFDTMSVARTLGWPQVGLAAILDTHFGVTLNKKYQRADWKRRPLTPEQLDYARTDTHYLAALRDRQLEILMASGGLPEVHEEFERLSQLRADPDTASPDPARFWRVQGARDLSPTQAAVLQAVFAYREQQAERSERPPFMVMAAAALMEIARRAPRTVEDLQRVPGMTPDQIRRHGPAVLQSVEQGIAGPGVHAPQVPRETDEVQDRYDRLHTWRKGRARVRGVESDVILPRTALWDLARRPPRTQDELAATTDFGPWRRATYGDEILALMGASRATSASGNLFSDER